MDEYVDLADLAERGSLSAKPGTALRGDAAAAAGRTALMAATGTNSVEGATRAALGRSDQMP